MAHIHTFLLYSTAQRLVSIVWIRSWHTLCLSGLCYTLPNCGERHPCREANCVIPFRQIFHFPDLACIFSFVALCVCSIFYKPHSAIFFPFSPPTTLLLLALRILLMPFHLLCECAREIISVVSPCEIWRCFAHTSRHLYILPFIVTFLSRSVSARWNRMQSLCFHPLITKAKIKFVCCIINGFRFQIIWLPSVLLVDWGSFFSL